MDQVYIPIITLKDISVRRFVDEFDKKIFNFYTARWDEITDENRPNFGPLKDLSPSLLTLIIEELIRREKLYYYHLQLLLPREARSLTCDENSEFSPFQLNSIELISKRCPDFEIFHYHKRISEEAEDRIVCQNTILRRSILRFNRLKKISLYDSKIDSRIIRVITIKCTKLIELNLRKTNISDEGLFYLHDKESVVKYTLTTLIIDETNVSAKAALLCLFNLRNLTHFQFDRTLESCLNFFENVNRLKSSSVSQLKTTIFKSTLRIFTSRLRLVDYAFQEWLIERLPEVRHLILMHITKKSYSFVDILIKSLKYIKHLELSAANLMLHDERNFAYLIPILWDCSKKLITLKLENFCNVNLCFLGQMFGNLEKLSLIKNCIKPVADNVPFTKLKEFEIIYSASCLDATCPDVSFPFLNLCYDSSLYILFSKSLEKVFIYDQYNFNSALVKDLLNKGFLRNLRELKVFHCPIEIDCIMELLNKKIPIETIVLGSCNYISDFNANHISTFIKENNYAINLSFTKKDPYCLRWKVLDSKNKI